MMRQEINITTILTLLDRQLGTLLNGLCYDAFHNQRQWLMEDAGVERCRRRNGQLPAITGNRQLNMIALADVGGNLAKRSYPQLILSCRQVVKERPKHLRVSKVVITSGNAMGHRHAPLAFIYQFVNPLT